MDEQLVVTAYCMSCKRSTTMENIQRVVTANGRPRYAGKCVRCGKNVSRMVPLDEVELVEE